MDKSKLASFGDRLKAGGAQMGRLVSLKVREVKDLLQAPTPESKIVDQATMPTIDSPDWGLNLRICALINGEELNGTEVVRAIKRKISVGEGNSQRLGLELLEACAMNCEKVFSEIASENLLEEMVKLIENPQSDRECCVRAMEMIRAWGESQDLTYLPVFRQTYESLKQRGMPSHIQEATMPQYSLGSYMDEEALPPPSSYPIPENPLHDASDAESPHHIYGGFSIEEKKEFLVITRNTVEVLSSLVNSSSDPHPPQDELTMNMVDKCKESQPVLQRIVESITEDETMLFEALNLHDELQQVLSKFEKLEVSDHPQAPLENGGHHPEQFEAQLENKDSHPDQSQAPFENEGQHPGQFEVPLEKEHRPASLAHSDAQSETQADNKLLDSPKAESAAASSVNSTTAPDPMQGKLSTDKN